MKETWNYKSLYKGCINADIIYELLLDSSLTESSYQKVAIDKDGNILGFLFSGENKKTNFFKFIPLLLKFLLAILRGDLGNRIAALKKTILLIKEQETVLSDKNKYDSTIHLFFVSSKSRGLGIGKSLLNNLFEVYKTKNIKNCILITDETCNYGFYDYYGFNRHKAKQSMMYIDKKVNLFTYTYDIL